MFNQSIQPLPRRRFLALAALATGSAALAGCLPSRPTATPGPGGDSPLDYLRSLTFPTTSVPEPTSEVTLTIASTWQPSALARQEIFDNYFTERHPNIKLVREVTPFPEFLQKYLTQLAGGELPDILVCQFAWAQQLIAANVFAPLDDYFKKSPEFDRDDITDVSISYYIADNKTYCVPFDCGPLVLFYNKDFFDEAGISYPTASWTMDDLKSAALALTKGSGAQRQWGLAEIPTPGDAWDPTYLQPFGGRYCNDDETECVISDPAGVAAADWWMDLCVKQGAAPTQAEAAGFMEEGGAFLLGRAAMWLAGSWITPSLRDGAKFKFAVSDAPIGPSTQSTAAVGSGFGITELCPNKDAAWIYMNEYLSDPGIDFMWASTGHGSPPRNKTWDVYLNSSYAPDGAETFKKALATYATSKGVLDRATTPRVNAAASPIWEEVVSKKITTAEGCDKLKGAIDPILAENR